MRAIPCLWSLCAAALAACGSVAAAPDGALSTGDAPIDGASADQLRYVIAGVALPIASVDLSSASLDLDGDGRTDNQLAAVAIALHQSAGFDPAPRLRDAIDRGELLQLAQYQGGAAPTFTLFKGANPVPAPCDGSGTCGQHLGGNGTFSVAGDSPRDTPLLCDGPPPFTCGPGPLTLELLVFGTHPFELPLFGARVHIVDNAPTGIIGQGILAGAVSQSDLMNTLIPAFAHGMQDDVRADCADLQSPPSCGCTSGSQGEKWVQLFDQSASCVIEPDELAASPIMQTLLAPDVTIDGAPGFSVGVLFSAVPATFTP